MQDDLKGRQWTLDILSLFSHVFYASDEKLVNVLNNGAVESYKYNWKCW